MNMKLNKQILAIGSAAVLLTGCVNPNGTVNNTGTGALAGGAFGALMGAAIGGPRHAGWDALIGAGAGALAGGLIGNSVDREQAARVQAMSPQTYERVDQGQPLSIADVKALAKAGINEDVIISQIDSSRTVFRLTATDIIDLRDAGVPDKVINYMLNTPNTVAVAPQPVVGVPVAPPPPPAEPVIMAPGPGYIWIGGEWAWQGGAWVWVSGHWALPPYPHAVWVVGRSWHDRYGWHHERGYWR